MDNTQGSEAPRVDNVCNRADGSKCEKNPGGVKNIFIINYDDFKQDTGTTIISPIIKISSLSSWKYFETLNDKKDGD
jgi:hypothetical protein